MYYEPENNYYLTPYTRHSSCHKNNKGKTLRVDGKGVITVAPDTANVVLGIQTENRNLTTAQNDNAIIATRVINSLKAIGIGEENINTDSYIIEPQYDFVDGRQIFRAYRVTNNIRITTKAINDIGQIVDTATANGANIVNNINFFLSDITPYYRKALNLAVEDALIKARAISNSLGVILDEIPITVIEGSYDCTPPAGRNTLAFAASTPIIPGQLTISATINATFNYE